MGSRWWVVGAVSWMAGWLAVPDAGAAILINELLADPPALIGDANQDGVVSATQDEFVELANTAPDAASLAGWALADDLKIRRVFALDAAIPGYGFLVVFGGLGLNNAGDTVTLRDAAGLVADLVSYGPEGGQDTSLTRAPDGSGPFVSHFALNSLRFSPGATADGLPSLPQPTDESRSVPASGPVIPEPATGMLLGFGLLSSALTRRKIGDGSIFR